MSASAANSSFISNRLAHRVRVGSWIGSLVFVGLTSFLIFHSLNLYHQLEQSAFESAQQQATQAASQINATFGGIQQIANAIANDLSSRGLLIKTSTRACQLNLRPIPALTVA